MSDPTGRIEYMFDTGFRASSDAGLIEAISELAAAEAAAAARRLAAIAELVRRRCGDEEHSHWSCDDWDSAAAEVSAALGVSHGRASGQMYLAQSLRLRLPRVAELFLEGRLSARVVSAIAWRTTLVTDPDAMALIDAALADHSGRWDALSQYKLEQAIDVWIDRHDPGALRRTRVSARSRDVSVGAQNHESGTAALWGRLFASDAALLERRLNAMAHAVCEDDPRTVGQRRADALGALAAGAQLLTCRCDGPQCPANGSDPRAGSVVIHVLADAEAVTAQPDTAMSGEPGDDEVERPAASGSAIIVGGGALPAPLVADLIRSGARTRSLRQPTDAPELRYRPSSALDEFVRLRDLTCRFPNCDQPAERCDIDHAIPWPQGPTHPSNLRTLCRKHHLLKTFWAGDRGWSDRQFPDGTIEWTAPSGTTYTTRPGSRLVFPTWNTRTAPLSACPSTAVYEDREAPATLMMPRRRRTRAADRAYRITCERALNDALVAERNKPPPF